MASPEPFIKLFSGVGFPILSGSDLAKGMWRATYEGAVRGRPMRTTVGHTLSQIAGSAVGRAVDSGDDMTGIGMLSGKNLAVSGITSAIVGGGIDSVMGRGNMYEKWIVPGAIDTAVTFLGPRIYSGDPRIL